MSKPFRPGEPISAKKLNLHSAAMAQSDFAGPSGSVSRMGSSMAQTVFDTVDTGLWVRVTASEKQTNSTVAPTRDVYVHSWEALAYNDWQQNWIRDKARFGDKSSQPVFATDYKALTITPDSAFGTDQTRPAITPYFVVKDPVSQKLIAVNGSGGGSLSTSGKDIQLMLLGTYDDYKDCSGVPTKPPTITPGGTDFCWPPFAWAAYKVCGYKYKKLFDMRSYGKWALELNGNGAPAFRRFYPAIWGWDTYTGGQPQSSDACAGVRFLGYCSQGTLSCIDCPPWMDSTKKCVKISFTTVSRPCPAPDYCGMACTGLMYAMDQANAWSKTFSFTMCRSGCGFSFSGSTYTNPFNVNLTYEEIPRGGGTCFWGPDEFDPCNPCDGFGRWKFCLDFIPPASPASGCDCGALVYLTNSQVKDLVVNCTQLPISFKSCNKCVGTGEPYTDFDFIVPSSVKIDCCSTSESSACSSGGGGVIGGGGT